MSASVQNELFVAIACGGTGGHLFPGIAVAEALEERGCDTALIVSQKGVDQQGLSGSGEREVITLPAVPLLGRNFGAFANSFLKSYRVLRSKFKARRPAAVVAMGGFTSAAPIFAGKSAGAITCVHEANSIAGKANRFLAPFVDKIFIGFSSAASHVRNRSVQFTGTPVRPQFRPRDPGEARTRLGLEPNDPVLLVMGGSQGATAINKAIIQVVPELLKVLPKLQFVHLTGNPSFEMVKAAYDKIPARSKVVPFLNEIEIAMAAATAAINRAGASSLAEVAAMQLPTLLIPYPDAADDHQYFNARAFSQAGAAHMLVQSQIKPEALSAELLQLLTDPALQQSMREALLKWHFPDAAEDIADSVLRSISSSMQLAAESAPLTYSHG
jgi:UDP-N-acetylglucosamine--N-acetylmuramyl-(pentapeptide) pyrophosphoryl-undecaprenol N-acetylglucosamine transferase